MKKILAGGLLLLLIPMFVYSSPPTRVNTYTDGTTIQAADVTENEDVIFNYLARGVDTYAAGSVTTTSILDGTITNADVSGTAAIADTKLANITTAGKVNATAISGTINSTNLPGGGITLPSGAVFFMMTGSCPSGTTDVSATYANKFVKINSTAGTSSGVVLTGTSDSTTLTSAQSGLPTHTHLMIYGGADGGDPGGGYVEPPYNTNVSGGISDEACHGNTAANASEGHTHTLSTATTLEPSSITCKMCQVD